MATIDNFTNLINAIGEIQPELKEDLFKIVFNPKKAFLKYNVDNVHFDFLPELKAFDIKDFSKCYQNKEIARIDKVPVLFISKEDLILN